MNVVIKEVDYETRVLINWKDPKPNANKKKSATVDQPRLFAPTN